MRWLETRHRPSVRGPRLLSNDPHEDIDKWKEILPHSFKTCPDVCRCNRKIAMFGMSNFARHLIRHENIQLPTILHFFLSFLQDSFIYSFERRSHKEMRRSRKSGLPATGPPHEWLQRWRLGQATARCGHFLQALPCGYRGPSTWTSHGCLPRLSLGSCIADRAARIWTSADLGCWNHRQWLFPLCHSTATSTCTYSLK